MDNCLIPKRPRRSQHTLANVVSFKTINNQVIDEILCMDNFCEGDLELFDRFVHENGFKDAAENVFECFLKIAGIESALSGLLHHHSIHEKLGDAFCKVPCPESIAMLSGLYDKRERPFEHFKMFEAAKNMLSGQFDDSKQHILAYLICIDKSAYYKGEYEVFYIIDYLTKGYVSQQQTEGNAKLLDGAGDVQTKELPKSQEGCSEDVEIAQARANKVLMNWAEHCSISFNSRMLLFDSNGFFESEALYLNDFGVLCKIIIAKRSHRLFLSRLCFIMNAFSSQMPRSEKDVATSLCNLLVDSYSGESKYTNEILLSLCNEALTKNFIVRTGASLPCFFEVCKKIDPLYIRCMNFCIEHLGTIHGGTDDGAGRLLEICRSEHFRVDSFQGLQRVVRILKERGLEVPVEKLCSADNLRRIGAKQQISAMISSLSMSCSSECSSSARSSLRHSHGGKKEVMDRVTYLLQESIPVPLEILKKCMTKRHPRPSAAIMFRSGSFKLFKYGYAKLKDAHVGRDSDIQGKTGNTTATGASSFKEVLVEELRRLDYSKFYQRVLAFLLDKKVLESWPLQSNPSPLALALLAKFRTRLPAVAAQAEELAEGLYFYKSCLRLSKVYRKFVFGCRVVIYRECLMDMPIIRFGEDMSIDVCHGSIVCRSREDSRILGQLMDSLPGEVTLPKHLLPKGHAGSFGMVYEPEIVPRRLSDIDAGSAETLSEQLEIEISVVFEHGSARVSLNGNAARRFIALEIPFIEIDARFYGVLKSLLYAETNEMGPPPNTAGAGMCMDAFYDEYINPIEKLLRYKNRKGVFIDTLRPFYLSNASGFLHMRNIIEHRNAGDVEFHS